MYYKGMGTVQNNEMAVIWLEDDTVGNKTSEARLMSSLTELSVPLGTWGPWEKKNEKPNK